MFHLRRPSSVTRNSRSFSPAFQASFISPWISGDVDLLFASIQTLGKKQHLELFSSTSFDYVVVDEFHHAAASSYQKLLAYFTPKFMLGLTATPERTDQSDILSLCDDNLVFDFGLFDGIESEILCPFEYQGIADTVDYTEISWRNGKFDPEQLENKLATISRAKHNLKHWQKHKRSRTLGFCVSTKHADFMAKYFSDKGSITKECFSCINASSLSLRW